MQKAERKFLEEIDFSDIPANFIEIFDKMESLYLIYNCAIREVNTKLENLNQEMEFIKERNPIQKISYRLKNREAL